MIVKVKLWVDKYRRYHKSLIESLNDLDNYKPEDDKDIRHNATEVYDPNMNISEQTLAQCKFCPVHTKIYNYERFNGVCPVCGKTDALIPIENVLQSMQYSKE
jgi:uncharacterized Fe-S radical SAM superfamily protein PflX